GNYTGFINGTAVPPGGSITVPLRLNITAAGSYTISVGGVPVAVNVAYLAAGYKATLSSPPVEALPGEPVSAALEVANTGNATISLSINGTCYRLQPRRSLEAYFAIPAQAHRQIILYINNTKYILNLNISIIFIFVLFKINGQIYNPLATRSIVASASRSQIQYQWIIESNATRRAVAVEAGGSPYLLRPGSAL
ncbi:MAG: hypothetical protein JZD41_09560, partial [Thermoproteus sp.]|nr:hypothetical protein [Thermoproteus sp.]